VHCEKIVWLLEKNNDSQHNTSKGWAIYKNL